MTGIKKITATTNGALSIKNEEGRAHLHEKCKHCGTWTEHWEYHARQRATTCCVQGCSNTAEVGAHVNMPFCENAEKLTYIGPMCKKHNASKDVLTSKPGQVYIYANQTACGELRAEAEKNKASKKD